MKQIWPTYAYSPTTNVLTLTGLNIDRDQLLLVTAADRGRIMYNFADSSVTASAFTSGANTALTLVATTAGLTTTAALVIYFDDQATSSTVTGTVELGPTSLNALESITVTMGQVTVTGGLTDVQLRASAVTVGGTVTVGNSLTISSLPAISGTVTASLDASGVVGFDQPIPSQGIQLGYNASGEFLGVSPSSRLPVDVGDIVVGGRRSLGGNIYSLPVNQNGEDAGDLGMPIGFNYGGSFKIVEANYPLPISGTVTVGNTVTITGTVTANTFALQGTAVTTSNFTSTTASTVLANYNATREVLTIFNEGASNLFVCAGATCTTIAYQVRLSAGDYYEVPNHQTTITHSAVFATAGTARVTEVS